MRSGIQKYEDNGNKILKKKNPTAFILSILDMIIKHTMITTAILPYHILVIYDVKIHTSKKTIFHHFSL